MTSQPRILTPVWAETAVGVLEEDCLAAFFLGMVRGAVGDRREWVRKGGEGKGASVNNPFKIVVGENLFTLKSAGRDLGGRFAGRLPWIP